MKKLILPAATIIAISGGITASIAQQGTTTQPGQRQVQPGQRQVQAGQKDIKEDYIKRVAQGNMFEIQVGEYVAENAQDPQVQQFAQTMVRDHTRAKEQLQQLAQELNVDVPSDLADWQQAMIESMKELQPEQLDRIYMFHQSGAHYTKLLHEEFASNHAQSEEIQRFAEQVKPVLQQHLQQATQISAQIATGQQQPAGRQGQGRQGQGRQGQGQPGQGQGQGQQPGQR